MVLTVKQSDGKYTYTSSSGASITTSTPPNQFKGSVGGESYQAPGSVFVNRSTGEVVQGATVQTGGFTLNQQDSGGDISKVPASKLSIVSVSDGNISNVPAGNLRVVKVEPAQPTQSSGSVWTPEDVVREGNIISQAAREVGKTTPLQSQRINVVSGVSMFGDSYVRTSKGTYVDDMTGKELSLTQVQRAREEGSKDYESSTRSASLSKVTPSDFVLYGGLLKVGAGLAVSTVKAASTSGASSLLPSSQTFFTGAASQAGRINLSGSGGLYGGGFGGSISNVAKGVAEQVASQAPKVASESARYVGQQALSLGGYYASTQAPEASRQAYQASLNKPEQEFLKKFETQQDYQRISNAYNRASVYTTGGYEENEAGEKTQVAPKVNMLEGFIMGAIPATRTLNLGGYSDTFKKELAEEYKDDPRFSGLSKAEKENRLNLLTNKEYYAAQVGGFVGQVGTEISSEIGAQGTAKLLSPLAPTKPLARGLFAAARTSIYGGLEGGTQVITEASAERRTASSLDVMGGAAFGAGTSAVFAGVPETLRASASQNLAKSTLKSTTKKGAAEALVQSGQESLGAKIFSGVGYALDPVEYPVDKTLGLLSRGKGVRTFTPSTTKTASTTQTAEQNLKSKMGTSAYSIGSYTPSESESRLMQDSLSRNLSLTQTKSSTKTSSQTKTPSQATTISPVNQPSRETKGKSESIGGGVPTPSNEPNINLVININQTQDPPSQIDEPTKEETKTITPSNIPSIGSVPVIAPQKALFPPFLPFGSGEGTSRAANVRFKNELKAAGGLLNFATGDDFVLGGGKRGKKKKGKK